MIQPLRLSEIAEYCGAALEGQDGLCTSVVTDSRKVGPGSLFVALIGERFDAHEFVPSVAEQGAAAVVVSRALDIDLPQILVADTRIALGQIAKMNRERSQTKCVAVTGSSGKTSVKEMLASMLRGYAESDDQVLATQGNLNNDIGAPLTLLSLEDKHRFAVVELGASAIGEIAYTVALTQPDVAILNNAMPAHVEGFGSLENIVIAKSEIYDGLKPDGTGIVNLDDPNASFWIDKLKRLNKKQLGFGLSEAADVRAVNLKLSDNGCYSFDLLIGAESRRVQLNVLGRHMVLNALAAAAAWNALGLPLSGALNGLEAYRGFKGRLQNHRLNNGSLLIDDSYNANPASMRAALDVLKSLPGTHLFAMGDMAELGRQEKVIHEELGDVIAATGVDRLLTCGKLSQLTSQRAASLGVKTQHYASVDELINSINREFFTEQVILAKGSRSAGMDRLVDALLEMDK